MTAARESNKEIVRTVLDGVFNRRDWDAVSHHVDRDVAEKAGWVAPLQSLRDAVPDLSMTIEHMVAEGDLTTVVARFSGTVARDPDGGRAPGTPIMGRQVGVFRVVDGRVKEVHGRVGDPAEILGHGDRAVPQDAWQEPILQTREIQGHVVPGFDVPFQALVFFTIRDVQGARCWLRDLASAVASMEDVLAASRRGHPDAWLNVGFSYSGLTKLAADAHRFTDLAFRQSMWRRSPLLGDPLDPAHEGNCANWVVGAPAREPDLVVILGSTSRDRLEAQLQDVTRQALPALNALFVQRGSELPGSGAGREHFGFRDPISQPLLRGRLSSDPTSFFTQRTFPASRSADVGGQRLIWPGEFIFGYQAQDPTDLLTPGAVRSGGPDWTANGSLLVFRRLRQDVEQFQSFLDTQARHLAVEGTPCEDLNAEKLAAKLVGRWRSGAPILLSPDGDDASIGEDAVRNNSFTFIGNGASAEEPASRAGDDRGLICPLAAHIRRAYPRDDTTSEISRAEVETHRLLRRGIPFGRPQPSDERGLLFLAYQTSIERQFEFVTRAWLNNPHFRQPGDGLDPIVGQGFSRSGRRFTLPIRLPDGRIERVVMHLPKDWVVPTGGGYYFVPSLSALDLLAHRG